MNVAPVHALEYAPPAKRRRFNPATWPPIPALLVVLALSALLPMTDVKSNPGGPFVSLHAEALPVVLSLGVIAFAWRSLRYGPPWRRAAVATIVLLAAALICLVLNEVMLFWLRPYSRGVLVSW